MHELPKDCSGKGIYFAEASSKSDEYATDDEDGLYCMLLCKAALLLKLQRLLAGLLALMYLSHGCFRKRLKQGHSWQLELQ